MVPNGRTDVSAATVPWAARVPLAVIPTALGRPWLGPLAMTACPKPSQPRLQLQQRPQLQYPVTSSGMRTGTRPWGGQIRSERHPDNHIIAGNASPAMTAKNDRCHPFVADVASEVILCGFDMLPV